MEIRFSPRDKGACPFCRKAPTCPLRHALSVSLAPFKDVQSTGLELVIYTCPNFEERF